MIGAALVYSTVSLVSINSRSKALDNAVTVLWLERIAGIDVEQQMQDYLLTLPSLLPWISFFYLVAYWMSGVLFFGWLVVRRTTHRRQFLFYLRSFLLVNFIACVCSFAFPCAPPRMLDGFPNPIRELTRLAGYTGGNAFAAMPSMLFSYSLLFAHGVTTVSLSRLRLLAYLYPPTVLVATVVTGNHFVLDALTGACVVLVALSLVEKFWAPQPRDCGDAVELDPLVKTFVPVCTAV